MASISLPPSSGPKDTTGSSVSVDTLPDAMNVMKIKDDKVSKYTE